MPKCRKIDLNSFTEESVIYRRQSLFCGSRQTERDIHLAFYLLLISDATEVVSVERFAVLWSVETRRLSDLSSQNNYCSSISLPQTKIKRIFKYHPCFSRNSVSLLLCLQCEEKETNLIKSAAPDIAYCKFSCYISASEFGIFRPWTICSLHETCILNGYICAATLWNVDPVSVVSYFNVGHLSK